MNYLLLFLIGLIVYTWSMIFAFYLIFVFAFLRISHILSKILGKDSGMNKFFKTIGGILDRTYQEIKAKEHNEDY